MLRDDVERADFVDVLESDVRRLAGNDILVLVFCPASLSYLQSDRVFVDAGVDAAAEEEADAAA